MSEDKEQKQIQRLEAWLTELVAAEETYISKLSCVVERYLVEFRKKDPLVPVPKGLQDKEVLIFRNIEEIYHWHKDFFLPALVKNRRSPEEMGKAFLSSEPPFHMYVKYWGNNDKSKDIVFKYWDYFNDVRNILGLNDWLHILLNTPKENLVQYKFFVWKIVDRLNELDGDCQSWSETKTMIETVLDNVNWPILQDIKNYKGDIFDHGYLIFHGLLECKYGGKSKRHHVFLLQRLLIFTDSQEWKKIFGKPPTFKYRFQISINELQLEELPHKRFMLKSNDPSLQDMHYVCSAEYEVVRGHWLQHIQEQIAALKNPSI